MALCRKAWEGDERSGVVAGQLWSNASSRARWDTTPLASLVRQGQFSSPLMSLLDRPDKYPRSRRLYCHQDDSVLASERGARPSIVVTAGTGAGKTESFHLPVLNDLYSNPRTPSEVGVRAIFLYPTNALVDDQVDRLNVWLESAGHCEQGHLSALHIGNARGRQAPQQVADGGRAAQPLRPMTQKGRANHPRRAMERG